MAEKTPRRPADVQHDQGVTQIEQGVTQAEQGVTQAEQGVTQIAQGVTQVAQGIKQEAQADAMAAQTFNILAVTEGVQALAGQVEVLNERVYAKTELDRTRNHLLILSVVTFVVMSLALGTLLWRINDSARADARQALNRSAEAVASRRALADCTNPPGTVLDNGFVNPGVCFIRSATRAEAYIEDVKQSLRDIVAGLADAVASNTALSEEVRREAEAEARRLRAPPTTVPTPTSVLVQPSVASVPHVQSVPTPQTRGVLLTLVCDLLSLVAAC